LNGFIWSDIILQTADSTVFSGYKNMKIDCKSFLVRRLAQQIYIESQLPEWFNPSKQKPLQLLLSIQPGTAWLHETSRRKWRDRYRLFEASPSAETHD